MWLWYVNHDNIEIPVILELLGACEFEKLKNGEDSKNDPRQVKLEAVKFNLYTQPRVCRIEIP